MPLDILCSIVLVSSGGLAFILGAVRKYKYSMSTPSWGDLLYFLWLPVVSVIGCWLLGLYSSNNGGIEASLLFLCFFLVRSIAKVFFPRSWLDEIFDDCKDFFRKLYIQ
jgi:hypothetical protein